MMVSRNRAARGAIFFALGVGAVCFLLSLVAMIWLGIATGIEHIQISFTPAPKKSASWWDILSLVVSLGFSFLAAEFVLRVCKKYTWKRQLLVTYPIRPKS